MAATQAHRFDDDGSIPNSELPVPIHHGIDEVVGDATTCEELFDCNGWWRFWRDGIYPFHHFHSTAHEALGVVAGRATVMLGGPVNGERFELEAGDVAILPAGTGHCNEGSSGDFLVVGAYPRGQDWDLRRGDPAEHDEVVENIRRVPLPEADPVRGADGPVLNLWGLEPDRSRRGVSHSTGMPWRMVLSHTTRGSANWSR